MHWIDWSSLFQKFFKPIPHNTSYYHFKVSKAVPDVVTVKEFGNSQDKKKNRSFFKKDIDQLILHNENQMRSFQPAWMQKARELVLAIINENISFVLLNL